MTTYPLDSGVPVEVSVDSAAGFTFATEDTLVAVRPT